VCLKRSFGHLGAEFSRVASRARHQAHPGQTIRAAALGTVVFSGWQSSYGRVIKVSRRRCSEGSRRKSVSLSEMQRPARVALSVCKSADEAISAAHRTPLVTSAGPPTLDRHEGTVDALGEAEDAGQA
jgi:hypothetical protein